MPPLCKQRVETRLGDEVGDAEQRLAERPDKIVNLNGFAAWKTWKVDIRLISTVATLGAKAAPGWQPDRRRRRHHGELGRCGESLDDVAVVGEIGADEMGPTVRRGTRSKLITVHPSWMSAADRGMSELAAAAGHCRCSIHLCLFGLVAVASVIGHVVGVGQKPAG
jgi:hypothetical protein